MERRDFLRAGTLAGAAPLFIPSEASADPGAPGGLKKIPDERLTAAEMDAFLARLDHGMARVSTQAGALRIPRDPARPLLAADIEDENRGKRHIETSMRSLLLAGSMHDLPLHGQVHPGMQRRLWDGLPEMDAAITGTQDLIAGMSAADRLDLGLRARKDPQFAMRIVEYVDGQAGVAGVSSRRRVHLRHLAGQIAWRMKHQSPSAVIEEYAGKVERIHARGGAFADIQRRMTAALGERAFWDLQERAGVLAATWQDAPPADPGVGTPGGGGAIMVPVDPQQPVPATQPAQPVKKSGTGLMTAGGICLGLGVVVTTVGVAVAVANGGANWIAGAFIITPGAILVIVGIILLAVGAARSSST